MKKFTVILIKTNLILAVFSILTNIYTFSVFQYIKPKVIQFQEISRIAETLVLILAIGFFIVILFHLVSLITVIQSIRLLKSVNFFKALLFVLLMLSIVLLLADTTLFQDIGHQYEANMATAGEWTFLYANNYLHAVVTILMLVFLLGNLTEFRKMEQVERENRETILFLTAQYVGVLCGFLGLIVIGISMFFSVPMGILKQIILFFSMILLLPYFIIVILWLFMKYREKIINWYDEKQFQDIGKSSLVSLVLSMFFLITIYLMSFSNSHLSHYLSLLWFPVYFYFNLFVFAGSVLVFSKR